MNRISFAFASLALSLACTVAVAADGNAPPAGYATYIAAARTADAIADPLQRCLAYPDLPGHQWLPGVAEAQCRMFLTPPPYTVDAIDKVLAQPNGATTLEATYQALLDGHYENAAQRDLILPAIWVFRHEPDRDKAERVARAWVAAAPDSAFAHAALGRLLESRGWDARGDKYAGETSDRQFQSMNAFFVEAMQEYAKALDLDPKLYTACEGTMAIGRQSSEALQAAGMKMCLDVAPASYWVVDEIMTNVEPRWGGSEAEMRTIAAYAQARVSANPLLSLLTIGHVLYPIQQLDDADAKALEMLQPAVMQVPNAEALALVGGAYLRKGEDWKAVVYLSQALRFTPDEAQETRFKGIALSHLGELEWARDVARRAIALDPGDGYALQLLGRVLRVLEGPEAGLPYLKRAMEHSKTRISAFEGYCDSLIDADRREQARQCTDGLLAAYPDNGEAWRLRLYAIGFDAPESRAAMERFLALADPQRWNRHAAAIVNIRKYLAARDGTAPGDAFDVRAMHAWSMDRQPAAHAYVQALQPIADAALHAAWKACATSMEAPANPSLVLVADVGADGRAHQAAPLPANDWSTCVAKHFEAHAALAPPPEPLAAEGYPVMFQLRSGQGAAAGTGAVPR